MHCGKKKTFILFAVMMAITLIVGLSMAVLAADENTKSGYELKQSDGTVTNYPSGTTFSKVVNAAKDGATITLYEDWTINNSVGGGSQTYITKNLTFEMNGHTIYSDNRVMPQETAHVIFQNGVIEITKTEFVNMDNRFASETTVEFKSVKLIKPDTAAAKSFADTRAGTIILDNVTVDEGDWVTNKAFFSVGYKTNGIAEPINIQVKNSSITLPNSIIFIQGASEASQTNGFVLNVDIADSEIITNANIVKITPSAGAMANCGLNFKATGDSVLNNSTNNVNPIDVHANMEPTKVDILIGYGVITNKPTPAVGTVTLGEDGDGVIDIIDCNTDYHTLNSSKLGIVRNVWVDDHVPVTDYAYTFVAVGDTQNTVNYDPSNLHYIYDWILANKDTQNIKFVFGMGDITNHSLDTEWPVAYEQITRLNGVVPYSLIRGNHDESKGFNQYFNNETYRAMFDGFYSADGAENAYVTFTVGDTKFLHITLDYRASNAILYWAASVIENHPEHKVIISTHNYIEYDGSLSTAGATTDGTVNSGEQIWNKLVSRYENIFLVLSGHVAATEIGRSQMTGIHGNTVTNIMTNGQFHDWKNNGAMGLISLLHFSEDGKTIQVEYYSTVHNRYFGTNSQFTLTVPDYEPVDPDTFNYLYEVIDANGNVKKIEDTQPLSYVLSTATAGCTVKLLGDASLDTKVTITADITIDLNGHTISTDTSGGRIEGNCSIAVINGTVEINKENLIYIERGNTNARVTFRNVDVISTIANKSLAEMRCGELTLDNVRVKAENWNGKSTLISVAYRTLTQSCEISVTIKDSVIDLGQTGCKVVKSGSAENETLGYTAKINVINSTITTSGAVVETVPSTGSKVNCYVDITFDKNTVVYSPNIFAIKEYPANVKITLEEGASLSSIPTVNGDDLSGFNAFIYNKTEEMYTVAKSANVGAYLNVAVNINVCYAVVLPEGYTNPYMVFEFNGKSYTVTKYETDKDGKLVFKFVGVVPQMFGDNIKATLYATKGDEVYSDTVEKYSVLTYCNNMLNNPAYDSDTKLKTLLSDLLAYGAAAQRYNGQTEGLVNENVTGYAPSTFTEVTETVKGISGGAENDPAKWNSVALRYENAMAMKFKFTATDTTLTVKISINGKETTYKVSDLTKEGDNYVVYFRGILATEYGDTVTAAFYNANGEQVGATVTYSVNSYVHSMQNSADENLADLVKATYNYGVSAEDYVG